MLLRGCNLNLHTDHADNVNYPHASYFYGMSLLHFMAVSLYHEHGEGLGPTWGMEKAADMVQKAGFVVVKTFVKPNSAIAHYVLTKNID